MTSVPAFDPFANYKCAATGRTVQILHTVTNSQATPTLTARAASSFSTGAPVNDGGSSSGGNGLSSGAQAGIAVAGLIVAIVGVIGMYAFGCFSCFNTRGHRQDIPLVPQRRERAVRQRMTLEVPPPGPVGVRQHVWLTDSAGRYHPRDR
jgi:hypothetical protein